MAVTVQTYSVTATWTSVQLANAWRQLLIDAGLMTDWYDSVSGSGYEHRILRLTNDSQKTYGYQYIWLLFHASGIYVQFATGWNASTHTPVGTQYADYYSSSCGASSTPFFTLYNLTPSSSYTFVRYTSGTTTIVSSSGKAIVIKANIGVVPSWLDLNKTAAFTLLTITSVNSTYSNGWRAMNFALPFQVRRALFASSAYSGTYAQKIVTASYCYEGNGNAGDYNDPSKDAIAYVGTIRLPVFSSSVNPAFSSNYTPIVTGIDLLPTLDCKLPNDFGFVTTLGLVPAVRDTITVTAGTEVWEVIASSSSLSTNGMSLLARIT